jgi:hypothetical protein
MIYKLKISAGIWRLWMAVNIIIFFYILPTRGIPLKDIKLMPDYILDNSIYIFNFILNFTYEFLNWFPYEYGFNFLWAFSVVTYTALFSLLFIILFFWVMRGFKI